MNNTGLIQKMELEEFVKSSKMTDVRNAIKQANDTNIILETIANKFDNIVAYIDWDICMLDNYVNEGNIAWIEIVLAELEGKLETIQDKDFATNVNALAKLLGIETKAKANVDKEKIRKAFWFAK